MSKFKHLNQDERYIIQNMLDSRATFSAIAKRLGRDRSTISKEVREHLLFKKTGCLGLPFNDCDNRTQCGKFFCTKRCPDCTARCNLCMKYCDEYRPKTCPLLDSKPYVCNGCAKKMRCTLEKRIYSASYAQKEYELTAREVREGVCIPEEEAIKLDAIISPLIKQGQSVHSILKNNAAEIMYSEKTIYNYLDRGIFSARNIDLPRRVKFKERHSSHDHVKIDKRCRIGRSYDDFRKYMEEHAETPIVEIDSVIGTPGGKCLLTVHFVNCGFMLACLRDRDTAASVAAYFDHLDELLGRDTFKKLFPVLLGDNGCEFSDPTAIEKDVEGNERTKVFYCDPSAPYQKGAIENNHEFIRRVIPNGKSFDDYSQEDIDLMMNHINSYKRENLAWHTPYEIFALFYGQATLDKLGSKLIHPNEIILKPSLLK